MLGFGNGENLFSLLFDLSLLVVLPGIALIWYRVQRFNEFRRAEKQAILDQYGAGKLFTTAYNRNLVYEIVDESPDSGEVMARAVWKDERISSADWHNVERKHLVSLDSDFFLESD